MMGLLNSKNNLWACEDEFTLEINRILYITMINVYKIAVCYFGRSSRSDFVQEALYEKFYSRINIMKSAVYS